MPLKLKSSIKVFVGIPQLASKDRYSSYVSYVIDSIKSQETGATIMEPYLTPPHSGKFQHGQKNRLDAIAGRMNVIIDKFNQTDASHLLFVDGDVELPKHAVDTLLRHNVDMASGVYPFHNFDQIKSMLFGRMSSDPKNKCGQFIARSWDSMKGKVFGDGERWSGGSGCLLVKRRVFMRHNPRIPRLQFSRAGGCGLDVFFWKRVQDAGCTVRVDANVVCGHLPKYRLRDIDEWLK